MNEETLLKHLRAKRCPNASLFRTEDTPLTAMNPVAPGGVVQLRLSAHKAIPVEKVDLPPHWKLLHIHADD